MTSSTEVVITKEIPIKAGLIERFPASVRLLVEGGTGFNNVDMAACAARGITVCNVPAYSQDAVAHLVITFVLNHSCSLTQQQQLISTGDRSNGFAEPLRTPHFELGGLIIGLIGGGGNIGSKVAAVARALGMKVLISSRSPPADQDPASGIEIISSVEELLKRSDFVSIHCPLNDQTCHLIDAAALAMMKPNALLINTARGAVIDEAALIEALKAGTIAGAALDVQDPEPAAESILTAPNCVVTPHIGWKRLETRQRLADGITKNIASFLAGEPVNVVSS